MVNTNTPDPQPNSILYTAPTARPAYPPKEGYLSLEAEEKAVKQIRNAAYLGFLIAGLTLIASLVGIFNDSFRYQFQSDEWNLIDVLLISGLSWGVLRQQRFATLGLLLYYLLNLGLSFLSDSLEVLSARILLSVIVTYVLAVGTNAAFSLYKHRKLALPIAEQEPKQRNPLFYVALAGGSLLGILVIAFIVLGHAGPEIEVLPGRQLDEKYTSFVKEQELISKDESIEYWYSDGLGSFTEGFYFFTDQQVVLYNESWRKPAYQIPLSSIQRIDFKPDPSFSSDSYVILHLADESTAEFPVSSENGGDKRFVERLRELWASAVAK